MTERCNGQVQEGVGEGTGVKSPHAAPQRRPSMVHREANTLAGDLHTSQPTKKDAKEVRTAPVQSLFFIPLSSTSVTTNVAISSLILHDPLPMSPASADTGWSWHTPA